MAFLQKLKPTKGTVVHVFFLLVLLGVAVFFSDSNHPIRLKLQYSVFDQFNALHQRPRTDEVVIVDIDEKSLEYFGQWPWSRNVMADLTKSLTEKGARAILLDGLFAEQDRSSPHLLWQGLSDEQREFFDDSAESDAFPDYDTMFANQIKESQIFITAFTYGRKDRTNTKPLNKNRLLARSNVKTAFLEDASHFEAAAVNLEIFSKAAAGNGSFMAKPDFDGILRRAGMIFSDGKALYPALSLEGLRVALLGRKGMIKLAETPADERQEIDTNYRILVGENAIPVESDGILYVHYRHFCNDRDVEVLPQYCPKADYMPAYKLLVPGFESQAEDAVKDKIVLIGASAEGLKDLRSTPLRPFRPGVEVHANVIEQILQGDYLLRPDITKGAEATFIIGAGLFFIILVPFIGVTISVVLCLGIIGCAVFGAFYQYVHFGYLIDPVYPSLAVLTIFIVSTILSYARAEAKRKQIRNAFGMYVAPDVMRDLEKNPDKLKLGGENRDLTVMFTDIRKFTSISEGLSPEELIQLMNEFLTEMTDIVMEHHGTVDKYIGDAMMTFWNAPKDVENHEREACLAALKMQSALEPINEKVTVRALELGKEPILLQAGIGVNTGPCAVGNMGSKQRFAYSALGDAVNLASRLEGQTKAYGVNILVGESTYEQVDDLALLELDLIRVVGKEQPVRIYGLFGDHELQQSMAFQEWRSCHAQMLECYRALSYEKALALITECRMQWGHHCGVLYTMYEKRIKHMQTYGAPKDWDGVYTAKSK